MPSPIDENLAFFRPDFLADPRPLFDLLATQVAWDDRIRARRVASFGAPYNYSGTVWPEAPMPSALLPVVAAVAEVVGVEPNNCLANFYPSGDATMGYHADSTDELEPDTGITIVSLGAARTLSFRREADRADVHELSLTGGSLLHMTGAMQATWRHAVLRAPGVSDGRISLTFRRIRLLRHPAVPLG